jgi:hypothetical protein
MTKIDKIKMRILSRPKDFTYNELKTFLSTFGYEKIQGAGSRICFVRENHKIKLHKPHPGNILKRYQIDLVTKELTDKGLL